MTSSDNREVVPAPPGHREVGGNGSYTVHAFASPGSGSVNTYWIETPNAVAVIDGQRQLSQARLAVDAMRRLSKPLIAIFVTHEHPDHVGGLQLFKDGAPDAPIYASKQTAASIAANTFDYFGLARSILKEDFPEKVLQPTVMIDHGQTVDIDGISLKVHEFGPGEAASMTGLSVGDGQDLIVADVVANAMTPFLIEGRMLPWIAQLEGFSEALPGAKRAYPGHGNPGAATELVAAQLTYFNLFRDLVQNSMSKDGLLSEKDRASIVAEIESSYSGYLPVADIPGLLGISADSIARELFAANSLSRAAC